jgi:two-component system nitrogen regulation sensor histidine kinase NtrY
MLGLSPIAGVAGQQLDRLRAFAGSQATLGSVVLAAAGLTGIAIFLAASPPQSGPLAPASLNILWILGINLLLILWLLVAAGRTVLGLLRNRKTDPGARLHLRFVTLFAAAATVPALVVALFYGVLVNRGVEDWFSTRVQTVVENSATVFRSYLEEQKRYVRDHVSLMAGDLNGAASALTDSPVTFGLFLAQQAADNDFPAAYLIDREGRVLARAETGGAPGFLAPPESAFRAADEGDIFVSSNLTRSLFRLKSYSDAYLYLVRPVGEGVVENLTEAEQALVSYRDAAQSRARIQRAFALAYTETALLVLIGAIWLGTGAARSISAPVGRLVQAAERVAGGDLTARVDAESDPEEIAVLSRAFNDMTRDLAQQQEALTQASDEAKRRRQFIETVLSEVTAGVVAAGPDGQISVVNRQAVRLLQLPEDPVFAAPLRLEEAAPEASEILAAARKVGHAEGEIDVSRGRETLRLRVRASRTGDGLVLTFDDITRLVSAQRNAAWRDVARRIAHEIKNPLTPIQLSAERIRRKFRSTIEPADLDTFDRCTETIVRQVGDIGRMVDEFSAFARMPAPQPSEQDAAELLREAVFARRVADPDIEWVIAEPLPRVSLTADGRMLAQALANVLKNASEAVRARLATAPDPPGRILADLRVDGAALAFVVEDNGPGLPAKDRDRLTEPYVTTREKGTGLGLAIVKRVMEEHGGELVLSDAESGAGARILLRLPNLGVVATPVTAKQESV